jgi:hypothetical protein
VKYISVPITDDSVIETAENLTVTLTNPVATVLGSVTTHTLTITDDDSPAVSIVANDASASEGGDAGQFTLTRTGDTTDALVVNTHPQWHSANSTDYATINTTQTIPAGQASLVRQCFTRPRHDQRRQRDRHPHGGRGSGYVVGTPSAATVTILDDDRSTVTITANDPTASESG